MNLNRMLDIYRFVQVLSFFFIFIFCRNLIDIKLISKLSYLLDREWKFESK